MDGCRQMTIFDFLPMEVKNVTFESLSAADLSRIIGEQVGLSFTEDESGYFIAIHNGIKYEITKGCFSSRNLPERQGKSYIGVGEINATGGCYLIKNSIEETVAWFRKKLKEDTI